MRHNIAEEVVRNGQKKSLPQPSRKAVYVIRWAI